MAFQDGFDGDTAVVRVNGQELQRLEGLTTRYQTSLARAVDLKADGPAEVEVSVPTKKLSRAAVLPLEAPTYVAVSVEGGDLACGIQHEPYGYV